MTLGDYVYHDSDKFQYISNDTTDKCYIYDKISQKKISEDYDCIYYWEPTNDTPFDFDFSFAGKENKTFILKYDKGLNKVIEISEGYFGKFYVERLIKGESDFLHVEHNNKFFILKYDEGQNKIVKTSEDYEGTVFINGLSECISKFIIATNNNELKILKYDVNNDKIVQVLIALDGTTCLNLTECYLDDFIEGISNFIPVEGENQSFVLRYDLNQNMIKEVSCKYHGKFVDEGIFSANNAYFIIDNNGKSFKLEYIAEFDFFIPEHLNFLTRLENLNEKEKNELNENINKNYNEDDLNTIKVIFKWHIDKKTIIKGITLYNQMFTEAFNLKNKKRKLL